MIDSLLFALGLAVFLAVAAGDNLVRNPSFEDVDGDLPAGWNTRPGEEPVELRDDGGHEGESYVRFVDTAANKGIFLEATRLPARPGGIYRASAWFRTSDECQPGVYLNFYDDVGARIHNVYQRAEGPTDGWTQIAATTAAPTEALEVSVALYAYIGDVGNFDADDAAMTVEGGAEPGSGTVPRAQPGDKSAAEIASRLELFVDSFLVDALTGDAERRLHHPVAREIALALDRPWEGAASAYFAVMLDEGKIRLYYRGWAKIEKGQDCACVAESEDGIHFTRPNVGIFEWDGSTQNNIIWQGPGSHNFTPFKDPNPDAPPEHRYKALASGAGSTRGLVAFVSADGFRWAKLREEPVITKGAFDSQNLAFWDALRGEYVEYHRGFRNGYRDIMTCTSQDFVNWTEPVWLDYGDAPPEHLYTNAITPYFRAPHLYLGFPCRFVPGRKKVAEHKEGGINDGVLMSSRDGLHFERWLEAFLRPSLDPKTWTDRNNYLAWGMVPTSDQEISLYSTEHYRYPTARLRRRTLRTDGFVSAHAGAEGGELLTRPLVFSGSRLVVNYQTSAIGSLRFELCDEAGDAYEGFSYASSDVLFGNQIAHEVTWQESPDLGSLAGRPVRLRVRLRDADLYSFRFAD